MKFTVITMLLLVGAASGTLRSGLVTSYGCAYTKSCLGPIDYNGKYNSTSCNEDSNYQLHENEAAVTNSSNLVYPCSIDDYDCLRTFLANNSQCTASNITALDPLYLSQYSFVIPYANMSVTLTNLTIEGLSDCSISDFYYNTETGNVVILIKMPKFNMTSPKIYTSYHRKGKESIVLSDYFTDVCYNVYFTVIIPKIPNLRLDLAEIHADMDLESNTVGSGATNSTDADVIAESAKFSSGVQYFQGEGYLHKSHLLAALYIQSFLCDFGIDLYGV